MTQKTTAVRKRLAVDRQQLLILLVAAVMVGSFFLLVLYPERRELFILTSAVSRERDVVSRKVQVSNDGVYVLARTSALRQAQVTLDRRLPVEPQLAEFLKRIDEVVRAEPGVTHEVERGDPTSAGRTPSLPVRLRLSGPFEAVYRCVARIETLDRLNRICRIRFLRQEGAPGIVVDADVAVYYLPGGEAKPAAKPAQTAEGMKEDLVHG